MSNLFQTVRSFFAPKPSTRVIEAVNECGEKRYIEMENERHFQTERRHDLEILLTKCKRLLSFVEKRDDVRMFEKLALFVVKVRQAMYRGTNIRELFHEYEEIEKGSGDLSEIKMMG